MRKSHAFGTNRMPLRKVQKSRKPIITAFMSMDRLQNLVNSIPQTATKLSDGACSDAQCTQAKVTSSSKTVLFTEGSHLAIGTEATIAGTNKIVETDSSAGIGLRAITRAEQLPSGRVTDDHTTSEHDPAGIPPSPPSCSSPKAKTPKVGFIKDPSPIDTKRTTTAGLPRSAKSVDFPSLAVLPPARLYGDDQEPSGSNVPFATDEGTSQAHARRAFLRGSVSREVRGPFLVETAMQRLGSYRMLQALFLAHVAPKKLVIATNGATDLVVTVEDIQNVETGDDCEPSPATMGSFMLTTESVVEVVEADDYDPLDTVFQQMEDEITKMSQSPARDFSALNGADKTIDRTINDNEKLWVIGRESHCSITDTEWLLSDKDFGRIAELSVSDVAMKSRTADAEYNPLVYCIQHSSIVEAPSFHCESIVPIDFTFSDDEDQAPEPDGSSGISAMRPTIGSQSCTHPKSGYSRKELPSATISAEYNWLLLDDGLGTATELTVSDVAEANEKEVTAFSEEVAALATPVLQSIAGIKSSLSAHHKLDRPKLRQIFRSTSSTSLINRAPSGGIWSCTVSGSSLT
ncbi:hypothetical protein BU25DRAFT_462780 [Macroventuria anomochaeta]|uniref:Uncharacterized protein n=1 Tax=Macroventuria anomochaeta TaxID=301207 RepID=A0ACB6RND3_9PLEO|nr:uncharacterized protein BU25DRAFT_462780 [Macroventuria anomochaeta]KAF2622447.1 hypothetical protein BU25DRAFT_462780 [Macroventuria anomochaeta]